MSKKMKGGKKGKNSQNGPAPGTVVWNGPVRMLETGVPNDAIVARLSTVSIGVTGSSSGLVVAGNNLGVTSSSDWASFSNTYDEFRVLGFELDWLPNYPGGNNAVVHASGVRFSTHSADSYVLPNLDVCVQHADWKPFYTGVQFKQEWKMAAEEEAIFQQTSSPAGTLLGQIYAIAPSASSTIAYGQAVVTYAVQFRGRK
jgi:hypothetical protein